MVAAEDEKKLLKEDFEEEAGNYRKNFKERL